MGVIAAGTVEDGSVKRKKINDSGKRKKIKKENRKQHYLILLTVFDEKESMRDLNGNFPEAESIQDNGNGTACHGHGTDRRIEVPAEPGIKESGGDRNTNNIVTESPEKILPDDPHNRTAQSNGGRDFPQIMPDEDNAGGFHGNIGSRSDRNADVGRSESRGVIDPVADHRDHLPFLLHVSDFSSFVGREKLGFEFIYMDLSGNGSSGILAVAGEHQSADIQSAEIADRFGGR